MLNELYNLANQDPALKGRLKFMAVGKEDNEIKMKMWKAFHKVPFAMIHDPNGIFAKEPTAPMPPWPGPIPCGTPSGPRRPSAPMAQCMWGQI